MAAGIPRVHGGGAVSLKVILASNNTSKLRELQAILSGEQIDVQIPTALGIDLDVPETGESFRENAILKAEAFSSASGLVALADDSGLVVDALGGEPGVYSARLGGPDATDEDRNRIVLERLRGTPWERRTARFAAVIAIAGADTTPESAVTFTADVEGYIDLEPQGNNGFGYDPIFFYPPFGMTFGQVDAARKAEVSHRGKALRQAAAWLRRYTCANSRRGFG